MYTPPLKVMKDIILKTLPNKAFGVISIDDLGKLGSIYFPFVEQFKPGE